MGKKKSSIDTQLKAAMGGYTLKQLEEAFALVRPAGNWKMPIDAVVPANKQHILSYAIPFYCGGFPDFIPDPRTSTVRVVHPGYYVCIGA